MTEAEKPMVPTGAPTIVHVVRQFHPGIGGLENFVEQLALRQVASGHRVVVVTLDRIFGEAKGKKLPSNATHRGIEIRRIPFKGSQRYPIAPSVLGAIHDADIVHVHALDFFCDFLAATAAIHRKPTVLTTHGGFFHTRFLRGLKTLFFNTATRLSLTQFGAVTACSVEDARLFSTITDERLKLILNAVDIDKFEGLSAVEGLRLIYFGRLAPNKEVERLLEWFTGLASAHPDARLIIAGKPMGTEPSDLDEIVRKSDLGDRVEIHVTPSDDDLRGLISRSSIYVCASSYEGFGLAAVEGASAGLFPVLSNIPAFADTVKRLGFGQLVDFNDRTSWNDGYANLKAKSERFRHDLDVVQLRERLDPFSWRGAAQEFDALYAKVLGRSRRRIGRVDVDVIDSGPAQDRILQAAYKREAKVIAFCNAYSVNLASRSAGLRDALSDAMLVLNDGVGVDVASRMLFGRAFPDNLNGTDFVPDLLDRADRPLKLYLVGGKKGIAEEAGRAFERRHPNVSVVGSQDGYFDESQEPAIVASIRDSGANLVLVAMGQPRQEIWAHRHAEAIGAPLLCVGALLDFTVGAVPRAPAAVRRLRLEWAYRLALEPRRLASRYLVGNFTFLGRMLAQRIGGARA